MAATDPLQGIDDVDWSALEAAYGPADAVPDLLRAVVGDDVDRRAAALDDLWGTVWHQGTVYPVTPVVVPFLVAVAADHRVADGVRAEVAMLLASTAAASSSVVDARWYVVAFARDDDDPVPDVELDERCRAVLAQHLPALEPVLAAGPSRVRTATLAAVASVAGALSADARGSLAVTADGPVPLAAAAASLVLDLAGGGFATADAVRDRVAATDPETLAFLDHIPTFPPTAQAVEAVRELCERALAEEGTGR